MMQDQVQTALHAHGIVLNPHHDNTVHPDTVIEGPVWLGGGLRNVTPMTVGAFSYSHSVLTENVRHLGRYCSIAPGVVFAVGDHPSRWLTASPFTYFPRHPPFDTHTISTGHGFEVHDWGFEDEENNGGVRIGNDVWIGSGAYIRGGVSLGDGAFIATNAVVVKDVPPYAVVGGNPGQIIKYRFDTELIASLMRLRWWDYEFTSFDGVDFRETRSAVAEIRRRKMNGDLRMHRPLGRIAEVLRSSLYGPEG